MDKERKKWLREQLGQRSECHLFNFGEDGYDIHSDVEDLLADNASLEQEKDRLARLVRIGIEKYVDLEMLYADGLTELALLQAEVGRLERAWNKDAEELEAKANSLQAEVDCPLCIEEGNPPCTVGADDE